MAEMLPPRPPARKGGGLAIVGILTLVLIAGLIGGIVWLTSAPAPQTAPRVTPSRASSAAPAASGQSTTPTARTATPTPSASSRTPSPSPSPSPAFPPAGATLCAGSTSVAVGPSTSCEFAANVAAAVPAGATGTFVVRASSPVTQKEYEMTCTRAAFTTCTGGNDASVYVR